MARWMKKAFGAHPGAFTAQAKAAGMTVQAFARKMLAKGSKASTRTKRRAILARRAKQAAKKGW